MSKELEGFKLKTSYTPLEYLRTLKKGGRGLGLVSYQEMFTAIEEALKRNEPMKVSMANNIDVFSGKCSSCGYLFFKGLRGSSYCPNCGQALDWKSITKEEMEWIKN